MKTALPPFKLPAYFNGMPPEDAATLLDILLPDVAAYAAEAALLAVGETLCANFGSPMGAALFADLTGAADAPNSALVPGVTRSAVSKAAVRLRKGFGLPPRCPDNARAGAKAKQSDGATEEPAEDPYGGIPWVDTTAAGRPAPTRKPKAPRVPAPQSKSPSL